MTPMVRVALGLLVVLVDVSLQGWDLVADPAGWLLVLTGVLPKSENLGGRVTATAVVALLTSLLGYPPMVTGPIGAIPSWLLTLPQLAFGVILCLTLARRVPEASRHFARTAAALLALGVAPPVVLATRMSSLVVVIAFFTAVAQLYLVYLLLRVAGSVAGPIETTGAQTAERRPPDGDGPSR